MKKTEMMKQFEEETGMNSYQPTLRGIVYNSYYIKWLEEIFQKAQSKATAYDELRESPNLPYEYELFLVYLTRNEGDFHKTVRALTDDEKCSLEVMEWFALRLGISWEPQWR